MKSAKPYPGHPEIEALQDPTVTTTVEFTTWEVTEALWQYLQSERGLLKESHITLQTRVDPSKNGVSFRLTYWPCREGKP